MKGKRDKGFICNSCYHRLDCNNIRYKEDLCILYTKDTEIELNEDKIANNEDQSINAQNTIEYNNEDLKLLYKKMK